MALVCIECGRPKKSATGERCRSCTSRKIYRDAGRNQTTILASEVGKTDNARYLAASRQRRKKPRS